MTRERPDDGAALLELLGEQHAHVVRLLELGRRQSGLIEGDDTEPLLGLLQDRQRLIERLLQIQRHIDPIIARVRAGEANCADGDRAAITSLVEAVGEALAEVMSCDERDRGRIEARCRELKAEVDTTGAAQQARSAYRRTERPVARFADRQG
jgi:hypothetical protein